MLHSILGVYRNGQVELSEAPGASLEEAQVIVTFLPSREIVLSEQGVDEIQAVELRARLACFAEDWSQAEMDVYDNYDAARSAI